VLGILRKHFPTCPVPADLPGAEGEPPKGGIDNSLATKLLNGRWRLLEETLVAAGESLGYQSA
jgi:hypothetical protein